MCLTVMRSADSAAFGQLSHPEMLVYPFCDDEWIVSANMELSQLPESLHTTVLPLSMTHQPNILRTCALVQIGAKVTLL